MRNLNLLAFIALGAITQSACDQGRSAPAASPPSDPIVVQHTLPNDAMEPKQASAHTIGAQAAARDNLPKASEQDLDFASRGLIARYPGPMIPKFGSEEPSIDLSANDFLQGEAPDTVNPALWRHTMLMGEEGLFEVTEGIYQARGFDVSNITFIEGETGYIVVDPLTASEPAKAAYDMVKEHVGDRPVTAVIYTHPHSDHFAGIAGVVDPARIAAGEVEVYAPEGFQEEAIKEWMIAGNAMGRRAFYQFGLFLPDGPQGRVGVGMGPAIALGEHQFIAPTIDITHTGQTMTIDGIEFVFQLTPGAEAPVEMNFFVPKYKALCMAETATASMHNVQTLRGASVRDAKGWADYLTEADRLWGEEAEVLFVTHHWPRFGNAEIRDYLRKHRDAYKFMHDQTVRMMNQGMTPEEISDALRLPDTLEGEWYNRGYYGTLSHNAKGVYDKYMGWYNGLPSELNRHQPAERAKRYVEALGGLDNALRAARAAHDAGDYRWAAELGQHMVFADPTYRPGRALLADSYEQMGYQAESAIWRNIYLTGAHELRQGGPQAYLGGGEDYIAGAASTAQLLDLMAVRLLPDAAEGETLALNIEFIDRGETFLVTVQNSVLVYHEGGFDAAAPTARLDRRSFLAVGLGYLEPEAAEAMGLVDLDDEAAAALGRLGAMLGKPTLDFAIAEP